MNIIAAADLNWGIGKNGCLLCRIPEDMARFRQITEGNAIVMGRKTLESFPGGRPLKNRVNIVLSRSNIGKENVTVYNNVDELLSGLKNHATEKIFIVGGGEIYSLFLPYCDRAYITRVHTVFESDTFMPALDTLKDWVFTGNDGGGSFGELKYSYDNYERIRA